MDYCKPNYKVLDKALQESNRLIRKDEEENATYYCIDGGDGKSVHVCTFFPKSKSFTLRGDFTDNVCDTLFMLLEAQMNSDNYDYSFVFSDKWNKGGDLVCNECTAKGLWKQSITNNFKEFRDKCSEIIVQHFVGGEENKILSIRFV